MRLPRDITECRTYLSFRTRIDLADGEQFDMDHGDDRFRVDHVQIDSAQVQLSGHRYRKDGSLGDRRLELNYGSWRMVGREHAPARLKSVIEDFDAAYADAEKIATRLDEMLNAH